MRRVSGIQKIGHNGKIGIHIIMNNQIEIKFLTDCQEHIPVLAKLWYEEISRHWISDASIDKAIDKLINHSNKIKLPIAMVAMYGGHPVGMACLRDTDGIRPGVTPWLGSLVVDPTFRGRGIGETLINVIKLQAKSFGYNVLYLLAFDPTISEWYTKLGWQLIGEDQLLGHKVAVMSVKL